MQNDPSCLSQGVSRVGKRARNDRHRTLDKLPTLTRNSSVDQSVAIHIVLQQKGPPRDYAIPERFSSWISILNPHGTVSSDRRLSQCWTCLRALPHVQASICCMKRYAIYCVPRNKLALIDRPNFRASAPRLPLKSRQCRKRGSGQIAEATPPHTFPDVRGPPNIPVV